eukprot:scaffold123727_cov18-Tisochrysis_lutea.AAC.1
MQCTCTHKFARTQDLLLHLHAQLEIKGFLESVYGMKVERVHTINYLGKRHQVLSKGRMKDYRDDDWKKAYVIFAPPEGAQLPVPPPPQSPLEMLHEIRNAQPPRRRKRKVNCAGSGLLLTQIKEQ